LGQLARPHWKNRIDACDTAVMGSWKQLAVGGKAA
jgi:hypothetical protein